MAEYGVGLAQFNVHSINVPEDDPAVKSLKAALAKRAEMGIIGFSYQQERSFDVMQTAAGNEGNAGGAMGAGMGLGMGIGMGGPMAQNFAQTATQLNTAPVSPPPPAAQQTEPAAAGAGAAASTIPAAERIRLLKELAELKTSGILSDEEFDAEKKRILAGN